VLGSQSHRRDRRRLRRFLGVLGVATVLLLGTVAWTAVHPAADSGIRDAAGSNSVDVTASSGYKFTPNGFNDVATNTTVTVTFVNGDTLAHTFTIWGREGVQIPNPSGTTPGQLETLLTEYPPLVNIAVDPGDTNVTSFTAPATGWYEFFCTESGHFQQNMYGFIAFGEPLPSNLTVTSAYDGPGAAVFIIIGTIVVLTVIAVVLGFVIGRRRGSSDEMPPERLGYPEPEAPPGPPKLPETGGPPPGH
jgi:plastocyanin